MQDDTPPGPAYWPATRSAAENCSRLLLTTVVDGALVGADWVKRFGNDTRRRF